MTATAHGWLRAYAMLALRLNRQVTKTVEGTVLIYRGPAEWSEEVGRENPPPAARLVEDADRLLDELPFDPPRNAYLAAQLRAMRAVARRQDGQKLPLPEYAAECLGVAAEWLPESQFEVAHAQLDAALPKSSGSLADRLHAWQAAHALAPEQMHRLPGLVDRAVVETRARTNAIVPLPPDEVVDCQLMPKAHFLAAGHHHGGLRSAIYINSSLPFNLADLLYVVAHEGHPGHIAESLLKEIHLINEQGRLDQQVRFMLSPSFVISEGLGLHAQSIIFPDDDAQAWLTANILNEQGIQPDGSDFAAIHHAKNLLWGVWANTAFLAAEGRPEREIAHYLSRWALFNEAEIGPALRSLAAPGMDLYVLGYYHGWRLVASWLTRPDRHNRIRRLLTEQLHPHDLEAASRPGTSGRSAPD